MNTVEIARVAAENAARKALLRFIVAALPSIQDRAGTAAERATLRQQLIDAVQVLRGELLAPYAHGPLPKAMADAGNAATRAVLDDFHLHLAQALGER